MTLKELENESYSNNAETKDVITDIPINLKILGLNYI